MMYLSLYHAMEKTANQNAGKPLYIRRYTTQHSLAASRAKDSRRNFLWRGIKINSYTMISRGLLQNIPPVPCIFLARVYTRKYKGHVGYSAVNYSKPLYTVTSMYICPQINRVLRAQPADIVNSNYAPSIHLTISEALQ